MFHHVKRKTRLKVKSVKQGNTNQNKPLYLVITFLAKIANKYKKVLVRKISQWKKKFNLLGSYDNCKHILSINKAKMNRTAEKN